MYITVAIMGIFCFTVNRIMYERANEILGETRRSGISEWRSRGCRVPILIIEFVRAWFCSVLRAVLASQYNLYSTTDQERKSTSLELERPKRYNHWYYHHHLRWELKSLRSELETQRTEQPLGDHACMLNTVR